MRRTLSVLVLGVTVLAAGCAFLHDDYPDRSCSSDNDCFKGRERCDLTQSECVAVVVIDAGPQPDGRADATPAPDAQGADAAGGDAAGVDAAGVDAAGVIGGSP